MNCIRVHQFGDPSVLKLEEVPDPRPAAGQVLVRIHAAGVNPVETYIRQGIYGPRQFPYTPGSDGAGEVVDVGEGVAWPKPGDRVYLAGSISGTYAQLALAEQSQVHPLPAAVSFEQGAAIGVPYATAYRALFQRAEARPAETLLVHGASGGVGIAAVQLARAAGLRVIGTSGTDRGRELVRAQGAHYVLDHSQAGHLEEVMRITAGEGVNIILEMLANANLGDDLTVLSKFGRVIVVGSRGPVQIVPRETMRRDADIRGMTLFNASPHELRAIHAALVAGLENGTLRPVVGRRFALAEAAQAHEAVMVPSGAWGKIVLLP
jgi:NADPH2:quinone reductase